MRNVLAALSALRHPARLAAWLSGRARRRVRDTLRLVAQSAAACAAAYGAMAWFDLPETSWAVISALFVVQQSVDGTIKSAAGRAVAALLGTGVGLISVRLLESDDWTLARLTLTVIAVGSLAGLWPWLRYAAVPATIIALAEGPDILGAALHRTVALVLGAAAGFAASLLVWPETGRSRTLRALSAAAMDCRDLLDASVKDVIGSEARDLNDIHHRLLDHLREARSTAKETRIRTRLKSGASLDDLLHAIERLWHGLIIIDRLIASERENLDAADLAVLRPAIEDVQRQAREALSRISRALARDRPAPACDELAAKTRSAAAAARDRLRDRAASGDADRERAINALTFALHEVGRNVNEVSEILRAEA